MFWLRYNRWDFADFGGFWYKSGGVGVQAGNRLRYLKIRKSARLKCGQVRHIKFNWGRRRGV